MSYLKFVPDLFLEVAELQRFKEFVDDAGFRKNILENSVSYGLIKSAKDLSFANGHVQRDTDNSLGQKTIKINPLSAIDSNGLFIAHPQVNNLAVPADGNWYWVKVKHEYTVVEDGSVSVDAVGNLVGVNTKFTEVLRGQPNFPSRIRLINSSANVLEYDVLEVTDDTHAVIVHPAVTVGGNAVFTAESNLDYQVVGTFTPRAAVPNDNKYPFNYDYAEIELVVEAVLNQRPVHTVGQEFFLARLKVVTGNIVIQDKRTSYWETKGSDFAIRIDRNIDAPNPLVGVENVKWANPFNTGDKNIVQIAWGIRATNWGADSSQNIMTLFGDSLGGSFKSADDFTDGDFNGWRFYFPNGKYAMVVGSVKQGTAINCTLDVLDIDNVSNDGGTSFIPGEVFVAPDTEEVEIKVTSDPDDNIVNTPVETSFPVNTHLADVLVTVYKDPSCLVNIQYRYKSFKEYTEWTPIVSGEFLNEVSFTDAGLPVATADREYITYTSDATEGFVLLTLSPNSYIKFTQRVFKGDIIAVNTISAIAPGQVLELKVGRDKRYQHLVGNINISDDLYISLSNDGAVEGNEFRIHLDATSISLGGNFIRIVDSYSGGGGTILKVIGQGDIYQMKNQDGGLLFDCVFDNLGKWMCYQNYDLGISDEVKMFDGDLNVAFDLTSGLGKIKGYYGWKIHEIMSGRSPIGQGSVTDEEANEQVFLMGDTGGVLKHKLVPGELGKHKHTGAEAENTSHASSSDAEPGPDVKLLVNTTDGDVATISQFETAEAGNDEPHITLHPYYALAFIKKQY